MSEVSLPDALPGETGTREWATWGRTHSVTPRHVRRPDSVPELAEGVAAAVRRGLGVRAVGSGCSFSALPLRRRQRLWSTFGATMWWTRGAAP